MKISIILFFISISLTKAQDNKRNASTSSESSEEYVATGVVGSGSYESGRPVNRAFNDELKFMGTLRKQFAIEAAFQDSSHNLVCSPVSALLPLAKLALGAESSSRAELFKMIGVSDHKELSSTFTKLIHDLKYLPGVKLTVASRLYVSDKAELKSKFVDEACKIFESDAQQVSFNNSKSVAEEINTWVFNETNGKIPSLLTPEQILPSSSLVIVNAIYFNGAWVKPFKTVEVGDFFSPTGQKKVQLMSQESSYKHATSDVLNAQIVEIPYQGMATSLIVVLPQAKVGLSLLINQLKLAPNLLNDALNKLKHKTVSITIPKFQITTSLDLADLYKKIGMQIVMSQNSGLTKIVKGQNLVISNAIQKAVIEIHETGTEAAVASAIITVGASLFEPPVIFRADHPFLFFLQAHKEQLFAGVYSEP